MKKLLLGSVLSTALLLAACGGETEEDTSAEETDTETTETAAEETDTETTETAAEEAEDTAAVETEEDTEEVEEEVAPEGLETIKEVEPGETTQIENVNLTINKAQINRVEVNEDLAIFLDGYEVGDKVDNLVIEYTVENTTEAPRDFFLDQSVVVTSTGQQLEPDMFLAENITASMLGAIEYTGSVPYIMDEGAGDDIEWVDINIPAMLDGESYDRVAEETKIRIEF